MKVEAKISFKILILLRCLGSVLFFIKKQAELEKLFIEAAFRTGSMGKFGCFAFFTGAR